VLIFYGLDNSNTPYTNFCLSLGVSIISAIIINFVWAFNVNKIDEKVTKIHNEALGTHSHTRYNQKITITFSYDDASKTLSANIIHDFYYKKSETGKTCEIKIFSDFRGDIPEKEKLYNNNFYPDFYFEKINIGSIKLNWEKIEDRIKLCNVENGKLLYTDNSIKLNSNTDTHLIFQIKNKYKPYDRLVWNFQDYSDSVTIEINRNESCKDKQFYFRLNHPNINMIMDSHHDSHPNSIRKSDGLITGNLKFEIKRSVLPYHGFEILWDIQDDS
jgi:hypothetical protein